MLVERLFTVTLVLGVGHDPDVWLEGAEIADMPLSQLSQLSYLPVGPTWCPTASPFQLKCQPSTSV